MGYKFSAIRDHYETLKPLIFEYTSKEPSRWVSPYSNDVDWLAQLSPIEIPMWMTIRSFGGAPFYPQYPLGRYYLDFANPILKIAIECDGKDWHTKEQDDERDLDIMRRWGWITFRISGARCFKYIEKDYYEYESEFKYYADSEIVDFLSQYYQTTDGLIRAIAIKFFKYPFNGSDIELRFIDKCLNEHLSNVHEGSFYPKLVHRAFGYVNQ